MWLALGRVLDECLAEPVWAKPDCLMVDEVDRLPAAIGHPAGPTHITSSTGVMAARPILATWC